MKAHIPKGPPLKTTLELNQKFGYGYQARMNLDGIESVIDDEPFTLEEVTGGVAAAVEEINRATGYNYNPHANIYISDEAVQVNKGRDLASVKVARDIEQGQGKLTYKAGADYSTKIIDGKEEICFSGRGAVLMAYLSWVDEKLPKAREAVRRYCEYLAMRGYGRGASDILAEVDAMDKDRATDWIRGTYGRFITDDSAVIRYIMQQ